MALLAGSKQDVYAVLVVGSVTISAVIGEPLDSLALAASSGLCRIE